MAFPVASVTRPSVLLNLTNGKLPDSALVAVPGGRLVAPAARAYLAMLDAAEQDGIELKPTSSADTFRPYSVQERIFKERYRKGAASKDQRTWNGEKWGRVTGAAAAVPGTSNHGWGLAVDIANASGKRLEWLLKNAYRFGFSWELQSEPWHLRYVEGDKVPPAVLAFERGTAPAPAPPATPAPAPIDWAAVKRYAAGILLPMIQGMPNLNGESNNLHVVNLRKALQLISGVQLDVGTDAQKCHYDRAVIDAVLNFQAFFKVTGDFPGAAHEHTRLALAVILNTIASGKA